MESMLKVLRAAGLDEHSAGALYATLHTYTIGFAALEASRSAWKSTNDTDNALLKQLSEFTTTNRIRRRPGSSAPRRGRQDAERVVASEQREVSLRVNSAVVTRFSANSLVSMCNN